MIIEIIKEEPMIIQWIGIITATFAGIALVLNYFAFRKQQKNTQLMLLREFVAKNVDLLDKQKEYESQNKIGDFCVIFLGHLEWLAYLVNNKFIPLKMADLYRGLIVNWYKKVRIGQKEVLADYMEGQPQAFSELDELYEKLKSTNE